MKNIFISFLLVLLPTCICADETGNCGDNLTWTYVESTNTLTISGTGEMTNFTYNKDMPWNSYLTSIRNLIIEQGVSTIGDYSFYDCNSLTSVIVPNSVTYIGKYAFYRCNELLNITIPNSVAIIENGAFSHSGLTSIVIPDKIKCLKQTTFYECNNLSSITIPNSVDSIGASVFYGTAWYNNQPDGVVYAGKVAYKYKGDMPENTSIELINGTLGIANHAFESLENLTSVFIPNSVRNIGRSTFSDCTNLSTITIGEAVEVIGLYTFKNCSNLSSINIPNSVKSIMDYAFDGCSSLKNISFGNSISSIGNYTFRNCSSLTSVQIPDNVKTIGYSAFYGCSSISTVKLPNGISYIDANTFQGCSNLTSITIPQSVTIIYDKAFYGCSNLSKITIPNEVTSINNYAFYGCSSITNLTIPKAVTYIGNSAFRNCTSLASAIIGENIATIDDYAFYNCPNLDIVKIYASVPPVVYDKSFTSDYTLFVPSKSITTYKTTTPWKGYYYNILALTNNIQINNNISTYCSTHDLDFTNVTNLKAYIASGYNKTTGRLMMSRVYDVPAGTGLLLKGETGSYEIPVTTSSSSYSNMLKGVTTATIIGPNANGHDNYILANGTNGIGFYPVGEEGTIAAGKAYLQLPEATSAAKGVSIEFDETTDIKNNFELTTKEFSSTVYDMLGRKVVNLSKGLYIKNGKKVIIK